MLRQHTAGRAAPAEKRAKHCATTAAVRRLVIERNALGVTNKLLQSETRSDCNRCGTVLAKMARTGEIFSAKVEGLPKHFFATAALARLWETTTPPKLRTEPAPRARVLTRRSSQPGGMVEQADATGGEMIITARTTYTRDVRDWPTARWQMVAEAPDERWPRFAASRPGIDPGTGMPWGA